MTKVGIYAIIRVHGTLFGEYAGELAYYHTTWVLVIGIITLIMATFGIMSSREIKNMVAYLVLASVSILLISVGINSKDAISGTIYYLIHSTLISGGLFLLADIIVNSRQSDLLTQQTPKLPNARVVGILFFGYAIAIAGLPPLSGFFGKIMILYASLDNQMYPIIIGTILLASLLIIISLAKAGTTIFFNTLITDEPLQNNIAKHSVKIVAVLLLIAPLMVIFANPITSFCNSIATDIFNVNGYVNAVLHKQIIGG
jgi:multicomponent K+:H+ antiporter subunit D